VPLGDAGVPLGPPLIAFLLALMLRPGAISSRMTSSDDSEIAETMREPIPPPG
jgi:hypothetical protein